MRNKRKIFFTNKKFQLRFCFYTCSWLLVLGLIFPIMIEQIFNWFLVFARLDPIAAPPEKLSLIKQEVSYILLSMEAFIVVCTFFICIFISHKIAGPIYKLKKYFQRAKLGHLNLEIHFRKNDGFEELADSFNHFIKSTRSNFIDQIRKAAKVTEILDKAMENIPDDKRKELKKASILLSQMRN